MTEPAFILAIFALVCSGIGTAAALVWKLTRVEQALRDAISIAREEIERSADEEYRRYNEALLALRQKINDVELNAANTYMRRDGFVLVQQQFAGEIKTLREAIETRFGRLDEKIDAMRDGK